ncbi:MAG: DUF411 domain-containing protein [Woeseia sp.]
MNYRPGIDRAAVERKIAAASVSIEAETLPLLRRRNFLASLVFAAVVAPFAGRAFAASRDIEVWTGPSCGCCKEWVKHLQQNGFTVTSHDGGNADARVRLGMPARYGSCHTAAIDGYAIEGHVPAADIHRLVEEHPEAVGLAVPAMPRGSPGMDGPAYGDAQDPYDVLLVGHDGRASVFQSYR